VLSHVRDIGKLIMVTASLTHANRQGYVNVGSPYRIYVPNILMQPVYPHTSELQSLYCFLSELIKCSLYRAIAFGWGSEGRGFGSRTHLMLKHHHLS